MKKVARLNIDRLKEQHNDKRAELLRQNPGADVGPEMTYKAISRALDVDWAWLSRLRKGDYTYLSAELLAGLSDFFGVDYDELLYTAEKEEG